jgi:hypothetical protein
LKVFLQQQLLAPKKAAVEASTEEAVAPKVKKKLKS